MIEFQNYLDIPDNFTGACKLLHNNSIRYLKNGFLHREDGPAIEYIDGRKHYYYKDKYYQTYFDFANEFWQQFVENKKREEELEIFK